MARRKKNQQKKTVEEKRHEESDDESGEIDYGATADGFVSSDSEVEQQEKQPKEDGEDEDSDGSDAEEIEESEDDDSTGTPEIQTPSSANGEFCTFDLRNLLAINPHQVSNQHLYNSSASKLTDEESSRITLQGTTKVNESYLLEKATDGCSQIIAALWQLPIERSDAGPLAQLPSVDESQIPRALAPPPPKKETKWEKFARERGIAPKEKRSRKVWDDVSGTWMFRHGFQKANDKSKEWPIMEVKDNEDPYENPWERLREEKNKRTEKNLENSMRNQERTGNLRKGTTTRVIKAREGVRQAGKNGTDMDHPAGVPVDLSSDRKHRGKASLATSLAATQRSTASLGKFDKMREGEPERKKTLADVKRKRKIEQATDRKALSNESERAIKLLQSIAAGGAERENARKKGRLAKGETAYDYEFDDGLGASTFRKRKGRAGAGKLRKMTKKRAK